MRQKTTVFHAIVSGSNPDELAVFKTFVSLDVRRVWHSAVSWVTYEPYRWRVSGYFDYWGQVYQCVRFLGSLQPKAGFFPKRLRREVSGLRQAEKSVHDFRKFAQVVENQENNSAFQAGYEGSIPSTRSIFWDYTKVWGGVCCKLKVELGWRFRGGTEWLTASSDHSEISDQKGR